MKKIIIFSFIALSIMSCSNEDEMNCSVKTDSKNDSASEIILQERDPNLPRVWSKKMHSRTNTRVSFTDATDFLGNSYAVENGTSIIGDFSNTRFPIIDIKKLLERYPSYMIAKELRTTSMEAMSYADFERLEQNSSFSKKVSSGFSLNVGIFKIGRKKTVTETFVHNTTNEKKAAHGELSVEVVNGMLSLQTAPSALKRISADYLDELFVDALYNSSMIELVKSYGEFVLTGYYTGGRASALYYGLAKEDMLFDKKEKGMKTEIDASVTWKSPNPGTSGSASGNFSIGTDKGNSSTQNSSFSEVNVSIKTLGGAYGYNVATPAHDINSASVDLTAWLQSLNDPKTHTMIDIQDGGLLPISAFILEENFKQRYNDTHMEFQYQEYLEEPYIEIMRMYIGKKSSTGEKLYDIVPVLSTRQGDKLIFANPNVANLSDTELKANSTTSTFSLKSNAIMNEKRKYYKLAIKANPNKTINPIIQTTLSFKVDNVDEAGMYKFKNPNTNIWYIYNPTSLYCFSYYDDDYILDAYGISDWVNSIPVKSVSMTTLYQRYRIFGL